MKNVKVAGLILGLAYIQCSMANPEFNVSGFYSAAGAVSDAKQVTVGVLNTATLPILAVQNALPSFVSTVVHPEIDTYNSKPDFQQDSLVALQGDLSFDKHFSMSLQVASLGANDWNADVEWAFLKYQFNDNLAFRGGRLRIPIFMYSETVRVSYDHIWVRPPLEVYSIDPNTNFSGADLTFNTKFCDFDFETRLYYGSLADNFGGFANQPQILRFRQILGGYVMGGNEYAKLRVGYTEANLSWIPTAALTQAIQTYAGLDGNLDAASDYLYNGVKASYFNTGAMFNYEGASLIGEWIRRDSNSAGVAVQEAYYGTLSYRFCDFTPYVGYAHLNTPDKARRVYLGAFGARVNTILSAFNQDQETITAGLRYELFENTSLKFQIDDIKALHGTTGLFTVNPMDAVMLYSAMIDMTF